MRDGVLSVLLAAAVRAAGAWSWPRFHHLAQALIPMAGCGVFLGLSATTVTLLHTEGVVWPEGVRGHPGCHAAGGATLWCGWLAWGIAGRWTRGPRRAAVAAGCHAWRQPASGFCWVLLFWIW